MGTIEMANQTSLVADAMEMAEMGMNVIIGPGYIKILTDKEMADYMSQFIED